MGSNGKIWLEVTTMAADRGMEPLPVGMNALEVVYIRGGVEEDGLVPLEVVFKNGKTLKLLVDTDEFNELNENLAVAQGA